MWLPVVLSALHVGSHDHHVSCADGSLIGSAQIIKAYTRDFVLETDVN